MSDDAPKVLLRSEESDGHLAVVELSGGGRPPLHRHDFDETSYVLEGELTFQLGGSGSRAAPVSSPSPGAASRTRTPTRAARALARCS